MRAVLFVLIEFILFKNECNDCFPLAWNIRTTMPLSIESEIDLLYHLSTMSEHVLPKGIFYLLLWKRLNQASIPPDFSFNEMIEHLRTL